MKKIKKINNKTINEAIGLLQRGKLVGFPTETVYGLGADATNNEAVLKIYKNKNRPKSNPLIVHVATLDQARKIGVFNDKIEKIVKDFWPGPLTVVLKRKESSRICRELCASTETIAIRISNNKTILSLIEKLGNPIAAPSANKFGMLSPTSASHVEKQFKNNDDIPLILDGGKTNIGVESTVIGLENNNIIIYRHGGITKEMLERKINEEIFENVHASVSEKSNLSPGMLKKHYSPTVPLRINITNPEKDEVFIGFGENFEEPNLSKSGNLEEAASNLFYLLEKYEAKGSKIAIAPIPSKGIGVAINDRLNRAIK